MSFAGIFENKRVFLTGHTGFKGAWTALWLKNLGAKIYGYALEEPGAPASYTALGIRSLLEKEWICDLADLDTLSTAIEATRPDLIIHMAAQPLVRLSYREPLETLRTNFMGTAHVLEVLRKMQHPCPTVIVTSDKCYENREVDYGYRESDPMGGKDVYSMSKGACELLTASYRHSFALPLASGRAGNVVGGGDYAADRIVPDCVRAIAKGDAVVLRNPRSLRPWQHVLEPVSGYLTLAAQLFTERAHEYFQGWNFGPKSGTEAEKVDVETLARWMIEEWGKGRIEIDQSGNHPHEAKLLQLNVDHAREHLKWVPAWSTRTTIQKTAAWYRDFEKLRSEGRSLEASMRAFTTQQIADYTEAAARAGAAWAKH